MANGGFFLYLFHRKRGKETKYIYAFIFFLLPTWAEKPVLMAVTDRREPQLLQVTKYRRFSPLLSSVSGDLHVLQVTYSTGKMVSTCPVGKIHGGDKVKLRREGERRRTARMTY